MDGIKRLYLEVLLVQTHLLVGVESLAKWKRPRTRDLNSVPSLDLTIHFNAECLTGTMVEGLYLWYARDKDIKSHIISFLTLIFLTSIHFHLVPG